jgi:hypothetical protein
MSSCACRRWGPGTTCEKPVDTPAARELETKMKAIMAEREKQANFWVGGGANDGNVPEYAQQTRQCDLNARSNLSNVVMVQHITTSNSSSQQMRFWN